MNAAAAVPAEPIAAPTRLGWVLVLTSTAFFMTCLDTLVVGTALPRIQESLHVSFASLQWTVNAYNIALAAGIICAAALGDRYGRRRWFVIGLLLFTLASAACALAPSGELLIAARALQGLGGAIILPLSLTILTEASPGLPRFSSGRRERPIRCSRFACSAFPRSPPGTPSPSAPWPRSPPAPSSRRSNFQFALGYSPSKRECDCCRSSPRR